MSAQSAALPLVPFERAAVAQSDRGRRVKQRDYLAEGRIPVIDQGQSPVGGYTNDEDFAFIGELPVVLFGDHTRSVKLVDRRFAVGADGVKIFRPAEGVRAKYLYYWMKSAPMPNRGYGRHYQYLRQLSLPLPPPKQQDEIVAEIEKQFSRLDEAVANLKRVKAQLRRYEDAVLYAAISGRLLGRDQTSRALDESDSNDELEAIAAKSSPTRVRRDVPMVVMPSPAAERIYVPVGWRLSPVAELLRQGAILDVKDGNHGTNHPKTSEFSAAGLAFITASEVRGFGIDYETAKRVSGATLARLKVGFAEPDDVILTHKGTVGRTAVNTMRCVLSPQTTYYRLHSAAFLPKYLRYYFASPQFKGQLAEVKSQTTRDYVPISDQYRLYVLRPPLAVQAEIVNEVDRRLSIVTGIAQQLNSSWKRVEALWAGIAMSLFGNAGQ